MQPSNELPLDLKHAYVHLFLVSEACWREIFNSIKPSSGLCGDIAMWALTHYIADSLTNHGETIVPQELVGTSKPVDLSKEGLPAFLKSKAMAGCQCLVLLWQDHLLLYYTLEAYMAAINSCLDRKQAAKAP